MTLIISNAQEAIKEFGDPIVARRKTKVQIRPTQGTETFTSKYRDGVLTAEEGIDYVVLPVDSSSPYPCKIDIFHKTWEEIENEPSIYRKKELCKFIPIPEGRTVTLKTLEGDVTVSYPNYIAIGPEGEVYSYSPEWVSKNLDLVYVVMGDSWDENEIIGIYSTLELAEKCKRVSPKYEIEYHPIDAVDPPDFLHWYVAFETKTGCITNVQQLDPVEYMFCDDEIEISYCNLLVKAKNEEEAKKIALEKFKNLSNNETH